MFISNGCIAKKTRHAHIGVVDTGVVVRVSTGEGHGGAWRAVAVASDHNLDARGIELGSSDGATILQRDDLIPDEVPSWRDVLWEIHVERVTRALGTV